MTPKQYCEEKVYIRGSSLFYTLFFTPEPQRQSLIALFALIKEIKTLLSPGKNADVARIKLAWWQNEIYQCWYTRSPTHPILQAINNSPLKLTEQTWFKDQLINLIQAALGDLEQGRFLDWPSLEKYLCLMGASRSRAIIGILLNGNEPSHDYEKFITSFGQGLLFTELIRDIGLSAQQRKIYIPMTDLRQFNVTATKILNLKYSAQFKALIHFEIQRCHEFFAQARQQLPQHHKQDQILLRPAFIMLTLRTALLKKLTQMPDQLLRHRYSLNPLHKLWLAYKTKSV